MLTIGEVPLLQRFLSQHLYSHLPPASLQGFKAPEFAASQAALLEQDLVYDFVSWEPILNSVVNVTQRGSDPLQSICFWLLAQSSKLVVLGPHW